MADEALLMSVTVYLFSLKPGFIQLKLGLTHWAGQNQFNPGKMPTLPQSVCNNVQQVNSFCTLIFQVAKMR